MFAPIVINLLQECTTSEATKRFTIKSLKPSQSCLFVSNVKNISAPNIILELIKSSTQETKKGQRNFVTDVNLNHTTEKA